MRLVGHGSSDNAASYGVYAFGLLPGWTALRDSISLSVYYGAELDLARSCVVALSQSGRTPDVVEYAENARRPGRADRGRHERRRLGARRRLRAGPAARRRAPSTPSPRPRPTRPRWRRSRCWPAAPPVRARGSPTGIRATAELMSELLPGLERRVSEVAMALAFVGRMFVIGRGPEFATAREISLKLLETCRVAAEPLDRDRPRARADRRARRALPRLGDRLRRRQPRRGAGGGGARPRGRRDPDRQRARRPPSSTARPTPCPVPAPPIGLLAPLLSVVPGQLLAWALAQAKGLDPDRPVGLSKVTLAL